MEPKQVVRPNGGFVPELDNLLCQVLRGGDRPPRVPPEISRGVLDDFVGEFVRGRSL